MKTTKNKILCYSHIPKAGGTSIIYLLRGMFGHKHIDVIHRCPEDSVHREYTLNDLNKDLRLVKNPLSLSGHWLHPYTDFGQYENQMLWFTILREPCSRSFSQFTQDKKLQRINNKATFKEWMEIPRLGGRNRNCQTKQIAGEEDWVLARNILEEKFYTIGIMEKYNQSMALFSRAFSFALSGLHIPHKNSRNSFSFLEHQKKIEPNILSLLEQHNTEDIPLYHHVSENLFEEFVARVYPDIKINYKFTKINLYKNILFRNTAYKPYCKMTRNKILLS